jgi:hypothetical protein
LSRPAASTGASCLREHAVERGHVDEALEVGLLVRSPPGDAVLRELGERRGERVEGELGSVNDRSSTAGASGDPVAF